jgi:hypothetical protein
MTTARTHDRLYFALAVVLGLFTAYIDSLGGAFHLFITALLLAVFGGFLGWRQPQQAWRWALIIGGGVYSVFLLRRQFDALSLNLLKAVPTFIPAFVGVYGGVFLRKVGFKLERGNREIA